jgi:hypothetical protein
VGAELAEEYFPQRIHSFRSSLQENRDQLPFFLLFLRLFPMSPNWALNMASGVLGKIYHLLIPNSGHPPPPPPWGGGGLFDEAISEEDFLSGKIKDKN